MTARDRIRNLAGEQLPTALLLTVIWILLWGRAGFVEIVGGFLVAVVALTVFPLPPLHFSGTIRPVALARLIGRFAFDLVHASIEVARLVLRIGALPVNAIIGVELYAESDLYRTLTAELVSLVPGSLVLEVSPSHSTIYVHLLGVVTMDDVERARAGVHDQERRLMEAIASDSELADYRTRVQEASR